MTFDLSRRSDIVIAIVSPIVLLLAWQVAVGVGFFDKRFVPAPLQIAGAFGSMVASGELLKHILVSLGRVAGARSGDKGGNANLGVWARSDEGYAWLAGFFSVARLQELLPETAPLPVERHEFPALRALNFVITGLLGEGVAASTRLDPQAKSLGEWLRARLVDIPLALLP